MRGNGAAIQLGGRGQTMGDWGAKTGTTTTSVWVINCALENSLWVPTSDYVVAWIFDEFVGSAEIGGHQLPVAEREQNRRGGHVRISQCRPPQPLRQRTALRTRWPNTRTTLAPTGPDTLGSRTWSYCRETSLVRSGWELITSRTQRRFLLFDRQVGHDLCPLHHR